MQHCQSKNRKPISIDIDWHDYDTTALLRNFKHPLMNTIPDIPKKTNRAQSFVTMIFFLVLFTSTDQSQMILHQIIQFALKHVDFSTMVSLKAFQRYPLFHSLKRTRVHQFV